MMVSTFNNIFKEWTLFLRLNAIAHLIEYSLFYMLWETKTFMSLALLHCLLIEVTWSQISNIFNLVPIFEIMR